MKISHLTFPELSLSPREAHYLRGYFGELFQEHSPLLHNHLEGGELRYAYPLVQYKIIEGVPTLVGLGEGAPLLVELFLKIKELQLNGKVYSLLEKKVECQEVDLGYTERLHRYAFKTLWMPLNQENFTRYRRLNAEEQKEELERLLRGNLLSMFKGLGVWLAPEQRILCGLEHYTQRETKFKGQVMTAFHAAFAANVELPSLIGLGKSVSRGFGAIQKIS